MSVGIGCSALCWRLAALSDCVSISVTVAPSGNASPCVSAAASVKAALLETPPAVATAAAGCASAACFACAGFETRLAVGTQVGVLGEASVLFRA